MVLNKIERFSKVSIHSVVRLFGIITENIELTGKIDEDANGKSNYKPLEG